MNVRDIIKLEHQSKFLLIDLMLMDDKKVYKQRAIAVLDMMAEENCIFSLRRLAYAYHHGYGMQKNDKRAISYLEQASQLHDGKATRLLGYIYFKGDADGGIPRSIPRALEYFQRAAVLNYPVANYELGLWYCDGKILAKNTTQGIACLEKAIELEDNPKILAHLDTGMCDKYISVKKAAAFRLGIVYFIGDGTKPLDLDKGLYYFQYASELGSKKATAFLAEFDVMTNQGRTQELVPVAATTAGILRQLGGASKKSEPVVVTETPEQLESSLELNVNSSSKEEHEQSSANEPEVPEPSSLFNYCSIL